MGGNNWPTARRQPMTTSAAHEKMDLECLMFRGLLPAV
jgi:hypothetical protein